MKTLPFVILLLIASYAASAVSPARFEDSEHFSKAFGQARKFRIFLPAGYDSSKSKRYPVVFYCHSDQGRYAWDPFDKDSNGYYPYNGEFLKFISSHDLIVVNIDGYLGDRTSKVRDGIPYATHPYYSDERDSLRLMPYLEKSGGFRFSLYIRELVAHIDSAYRTFASPQYRGITGLSMGGHASIFIGANNPDLFQSVSSFCHSCGFHPVGLRPYQTRAMAFDLWRNFTGCQVRTNQNTMDYLSFYDQELGRYLRIGGFPYEYHVAQFNRHWAADADSQLLFHLRSFQSEKRRPDRFGFVSLYPEFDVWGWDFKTEKKEPGWTVLENAGASGLNVYTTLHFRYRVPLSDYRISFSTPSLYRPSQALTVTDFNANDGKFSVRTLNAGKDGRLADQLSGGFGHAVGILEKKMPLVTLWPFENNTTLFLQAGRDTLLPVTVINKGTLPSGKIEVEAQALSHWIKLRNLTVSIPPLGPGERRTIPGAFRLSVRVADTIPIGGVRFRIKNEAMTLPVQAMDSLIPQIRPKDVLVLDGRETTIQVFLPYRYGGEGLMVPQKIQGGKGNGNGISEPGETVIVFVRDSVGLSPKDTNTFHPAYFVNGPVPGVRQTGLFEFLCDSVYSCVGGDRAQAPLGGEVQILSDFKPGARLVMVHKVFKTRVIEESAKNVDEYRFRYGVVELR